MFKVINVIFQRKNTRLVSNIVLQSTEWIMSISNTCLTLDCTFVHLVLRSWSNASWECSYNDDLSFTFWYQKIVTRSRTGLIVWTLKDCNIFRCKKLYDNTLIVFVKFRIFLKNYSLRTTISTFDVLK